jgi:hypothetical protein
MISGQEFRGIFGFYQDEKFGWRASANPSKRLFSDPIDGRRVFVVLGFGLVSRW